MKVNYSKISKRQVKFNKLSGISLVETMVAFALLMIILPFIYKSMFQTQQYFSASETEIKLKIETHTAMEHILKDLREISGIFGNDTIGIQDFKNTYMNDSTGNSFFPSEDKEQQPLILFMKYDGEKTLLLENENKVLKEYKIVAYYASDIKKNDSFYDKNFKTLSITKIISKEKFVDPTPLSISERESLQSNTIKFWTPPKKGYKADLPDTTNLNFIRTKLSVSTALGNIILNEKKVPEYGGLYFSKGNNSIKVTILSARKSQNGIKKYFLTSEIYPNSIIIM